MNLFIAMMYQPWELCDDVFTQNKITSPAKQTLREVAAKHLFSVWIWLWCGSQSLDYKQNTPHPT